MSKTCPCDTHRDYTNCCGLYITGKETAPTPEALMRSRYSAFVKRKFAYLNQTIAGPAAKQFNLQQAQRDAAQLKWLHLEVLQSNMCNENQATVEFKAHFRLNNRKSALHEISLFDKIDKKWFYVDQLPIT